MKKMTVILVFFMSISLFSTLSAQGYGTAIGARFGNGWGLTMQNQVALKTTVEVILQSGFTQQDVTLSVIGERHTNILTRGLNIYTGAGLYYTWLETRENVIKQPTNPWGIAPIGGVELSLGKFNFSADFKPLLRVGGGENASDIKRLQWQTGISVRYIIASRYFKNDDWKFWENWFKKKKK